VDILPTDKEEKNIHKNHPVKIDKVIISKNDNKTSDNSMKKVAFRIKSVFFS